MRNKRRSRMLQSLTALTLLLALSVFSIVITPVAFCDSPGSAFEDVTEAALQGMEGFLKAIPPQDLKQYGFTQGTTDGSVLMDPYRVYTIEPAVLLAASSDAAMNSLIVQTDLWLFPIAQDGVLNTLLTVDLVDGNWSAVAIGSSGMANQLQLLRNTLTDGELSGLRLVRVFQAKSDFILVQDNTETIILLQSAVVSLGLESSQDEDYPRYNSSDILARLKAVVAQSLGSTEE